MTSVLITGASRGIGLELARQYAEAGDRVYAFCRSKRNAEQLLHLANESNGLVSVHVMDVADEKSIRSAAGEVGGAPIAILINNAGIFGGNAQSLESINVENWIEALRVMTIGPFLVVQTFLDNLKAANGAKVMTITSQLSSSVFPNRGITYAYSSAKAGVNKVTQMLARDLSGHKIAVNVIHPGHVKTDMGGESAAISPRESASGIRKVIAAIGESDTGKFYQWNGEIYPW